MHSGKEPSCQACLDARMRPRFTTDLPPKLLMSNISCFPRSPPNRYLSLFRSLSLSAFTHARSTWVSASTADMISISLQCCYGNQHFGTTVLQSCNGSVDVIFLQPDIPSLCHVHRAHTWGCKLLKKKRSYWKVVLTSSCKTHNSVC